MKTLIVAEKPSVARDLARALPGVFVEDEACLRGPDHIVTYAVGHLLELARPEDYEKTWKRWRLDGLPMIPKVFKVRAIPGRSREQLRAVHKLLSDPEVDEIWNACDAGREGELIFAWILESAPASARSKPVRRLWLSSLDAAAIQTAIAEIKAPGSTAKLEAAARSRAESDWLVGINATRSATVHLGKNLDGVISLGRVQTPTLALLVNRELERQSFETKAFWTVKAKFMTDDGQSYYGEHASGRMDEAEAKAIVSAVRGQSGEVTAVERKPGQDQPPLLFDLTSLQRLANKEWGWSAKRTLGVAQSLYERHKALTYPRTDSRYLPSSMASQLPETALSLCSIEELSGPAKRAKDLASNPGSRIVNDAKVTDHHAIIPTGIDPPLQAMDDSEQRLFEAVARRYLAVFFPEAKYQRTLIQTEAKGQLFLSKGKVYSQAGWRELYPGSGEDSPLPDIAAGQVVATAEVAAERGQTKPPPRYSEATLLGAMETAGKEIDDEGAREAMKELGLGTPATRAQIIERLLAVEYVERQGRQLVPTGKGIEIISLLGNSPLVSAELSGQWEKSLRGIQEGDLERQEFMSGMNGFVAELVKSISALPAPKAEPGAWGQCPGCGQALIENRKAISCWQSKEDPGCGFVLWKRVAGKALGKKALRELIKEKKTSEAVAGFKSKRGKSFSARLALKREGDSWVTVFDEEWAQGAKQKSS
jgi:DNA topoisomerase-3